MSQPVGHISLPYPTTEQGSDSLEHLIRAAINPGTVPAADMAAHAWIVAGAALRITLPPSGGPIVGAAGGPQLSPSQIDALKQLQGMRAEMAAGHQAANFDPERWRNLLKIVLPIILSLLGI